MDVAVKFMQSFYVRLYQTSFAYRPTAQYIATWKKHVLVDKSG